MTTAENLFVKDSNEKKAIGRSASHSARRKSRKKVTFPFESIDGRTKAGRKYKGRGLVVTYKWNGGLGNGTAL